MIITGTTCTGKTTLGKKVAKSLSIAQVDLDEYHFLPNWVEKEKHQFVKDVFAVIDNQKEWVVSGSYQSIFKDSLWKQAFTIVWLDYPLHVILQRYIKRTFRRVVYKEPCCGENYETLGRTFSKDSLFLWIFKSYWVRKERMRKWKQDDFADKEWIVLTHPKQATKFLAQL
ncbi:MAG: AAA family ATPase [Bacteroidota bacterium]